MLAKDIMSKKPEFLPPTTSLKQAADQMRTHDYGFLPIGENDRLIGAVTDRDIIIRGIANGKDPSNTPLRDVMTKGIHYCYETDSLEKLVQQMEKLQIRRLVVLNKDKRMTGIITLGDIAVKAENAKLCRELADSVAHH
ncbi:MAG: inosine-5-monophosphate dehydrogenase [Gammaproteobacteria bacterium RIFCSPHIGHO2_12_FULL_43_28]|nr:MAG: inosine-5-monophosphate dehydrogenase [Gammaproteobacteria bacterium RIFCSPHIGHO2_12_FULL_43_28]